MKSQDRFSRVVAICCVIVIAGCAGDDPAVPVERVGTIVIDSDPDSILAHFTIEGPSSWTEWGFGDRAYQSMPAGSYEISWGSHIGWIAPSGESLTLTADSVITFVGLYVQQPAIGTIVIDQSPDILSGAGWSLAGESEGFGVGDSVLAGMAPGVYTITWADVDGYITPLPEVQSLFEYGTIVFSGAYAADETPPTPPAGYALVREGAYWMGSPPDEIGHEESELQHLVNLRSPFFISITEVSNQQYLELMQFALDNGWVSAWGDAVHDMNGTSVAIAYLGNSDLSYVDGEFVVDPELTENPVTGITWFGAAAYCNWLSLREGRPISYDWTEDWSCGPLGSPYDAAGYRLPTEAEWEFACRSESVLAFANGPLTNPDCSPVDPYLNEIGWYCGNSGPASHPAGELESNSWGIFDMHGNRSEWCNDWYDVDYYSYSPINDPEGPIVATQFQSRVVRGGNSGAFASRCRSAYRGAMYPSNTSPWVSFRPVLLAD